MTEIEKAWEAGYRAGKLEAQREAYEKYRMETEILRQQHDYLLVTISKLDALRLHTLETK